MPSDDPVAQLVDLENNLNLEFLDTYELRDSVVAL